MTTLAQRKLRTLHQWRSEIAMRTKRRDRLEVPPAARIEVPISRSKPKSRMVLWLVQERRDQPRTAPLGPADGSFGLRPSYFVDGGVSMRNHTPLQSRIAATHSSLSGSTTSAAL